LEIELKFNKCIGELKSRFNHRLVNTSVVSGFPGMVPESADEVAEEARGGDGDGEAATGGGRGRRRRG